MLKLKFYFSYNKMNYLDENQKYFRKCYPHISKNIKLPSGFNSSDELYKTLMRTDPQNGKNCRWIIDRFKSGEVLIEDLEQLKADLETFFQIVPFLKAHQKKLSSYESYAELKQVIEPFESLERVDISRMETTEDYEILKTPWGVLSKVLTQKGACELGKSTKWCTASTIGKNPFNDFIRDGPIYIWQDYELKNKKVQFQFESGQFMNEQDIRISKDLINYYRTQHPVLKELFKQYEDKLLSLELEENENYINYMIAIGIKRWPELEYALLNNKKSLLLAEYAEEFINTRWPEAEPIILLDAEASWRYALNLIRGPWPKRSQ